MLCIILETDFTMLELFIAMLGNHLETVYCSLERKEGLLLAQIQVVHTHN